MRHAAFLFLALLLAPGGSAADSEEAPPLHPGLVLTLEVATRDGESHAPAKDARRARMVALHVPEGAPASPFLPPGPFRARWEGWILSEFLDDYTFSVEGRGTVRLLLNGELAIEHAGEDLAEAPEAVVELEEGPNRLEVDYGSPSDGAATLRLNWSSIDFRREPVPPTVLRHDARSTLLETQTLLRLGRELFATRRCHRCHRAPAGTASWDGGMPELEMDSPLLEVLAARLRPEWVARWVADPRALRPQATMPRLLPPEDPPSSLQETDQRARDVAAYLEGLGRESQGDAVREEPAPGAEAEAAPRGEKLYTETGCVACHVLEESERRADEDPALPRHSLAAVRGKWDPLALEEFLIEPEKSARWIRMPNFQLDRDASRELVAFLRSRGERESGAPIEPTRGDAVRGRELVETLGCANCHSGDGDAGMVVSRLEAPSLVVIARGERVRGCLAAAPELRGGAPDFQFSASEREALKTFLATALPSLRQCVPEEFAARQVRALRCGGCHIIDGKIDLWSKLTAPEGASSAEELLARRILERTQSSWESGGGEPDSEEKTLDQSRPHLTWAGEKLRPEWTTSLLEGKLGYRTRPWLMARMPFFPARAPVLSIGLARQHGYPPLRPEHPPSNPDLAAIGRKLVVREGGFGCVSCHDIGDQPATGVFEVKGVNFQYVRERLLVPYFRRWMMDPPRITPETRMPRFADDQGLSPFAATLQGDAARQFEAIWQYLLEGRDIRPPE